jgi:glucan phosphorylase
LSLRLWQRIAYNLWWRWSEATNLFRRIDADLWQTIRHNPVRCWASCNRPLWKSLRMKSFHGPPALETKN